MEKYIVTKQEIADYPGIEKTHFLNSNAVRRNKSLGDLTGLNGIGFHIIEIEPGFDSTEFHQHYFEEECVYILAGEAEARIGDNISLVKAGDFIGYRAGGLAHSLKNIGDQVLLCIVVGQRLQHDVADYPDLKKRLYRNKGRQWNLVDIAAIETPVAGEKK
ncbi:cupin domain-containing protein [Thalassomonas haliotis]|uniref:Cupin domain-containing protein n=1 Tax=Thalassomonas haliotis TaxID=485448 RepID=A0ABY7VKT8_9GAMM|nr:cupin domain-containing protein [Thalassomonas haliotis]WDE14088.1 cupin domain-containing protein [Thalassomonas haliotis]